MKIYNKQMKILIVDDSPSNIRVLSETLGQEYHVIYAMNGPDALASAVNGNPDLILLDIMMPGMDGYEVCTKLKANSNTSEIPIIFITALDAEQHETVGLELGGIDYITKPINPNLVRLRVRNHIELKVLQDHYKNLSTIDGLTGIANRRRFNDFIEQEWRRSMRSQSVLSLIMIDIDNFKQYNDHYGHSVGDDCLKMIAVSMFGALERATDLLARYGGEEFVCVLPGTDIEGAKILGEKLRSKVVAMKIPHCKTTTGLDYVTISMGISTVVPTKNDDWNSILELADNNLYRAKSQGRNCLAC
ncbi:MAG: diguanylate cyclase [Magnetococcales bacterium]|nr:diguanylate cyclase [Magnetococcales bacterium]